MSAPLTISAWLFGGAQPPGESERSFGRSRDADGADDIPAITDDDTAILLAIRAGDEHAFATLFTRYVDKVAAFAYRYVGSADTARDVTQDVFIRTWERRVDLPSAGIRAYLFRVARNRALDLLGHDTIVARWAAAVRLARDDDTATVSNTGEQSIENDELVARVNAALATLTPRAREIVRLVREEGLKPGEVAVLLQLTPGTVYVHLSRALKQLAAALRE